MTLVKQGDHYEPKYWDIFSMAMVIYFMWSGEHPLNEFSNPFLINDEISKGTRPLLTTRMPEGLRELVRKMWDQNYKKRPPFKEISIHLEKIQAETTQSINENVDTQNVHIQLNPLL